MPIHVLRALWEAQADLEDATWRRTQVQTRLAQLLAAAQLDYRLSDAALSDAVGIAPFTIARLVRSASPQTPPGLRQESLFPPPGAKPLDDTQPELFAYLIGAAQQGAGSDTAMAAPSPAQTVPVSAPASTPAADLAY